MSVKSASTLARCFVLSRQWQRLPARFRFAVRSGTAWIVESRRPSCQRWVTRNLARLDIEKEGDWVSDSCDAFILLHVMEHLYSPEAVFQRIARAMKPGSVMIGGFPSVPHLWVRLKEPHLIHNPDPGSHRSAFSPKRVRSIARTCGLNVDFLSGAFFLRASGLLLENFSWWLRFNLLFGSVFPSWPGEIYWVLRKPTASGAGLVS